MKLDTFASILSEDNDNSPVNETGELSGALSVLKFIVFIASVFVSVFLLLSTIRKQVNEICSDQSAQNAIVEQNFIDRLYQTIMKRDIEAIKGMLEDSPHNLDIASNNFETCLQLAVRLGSIPIVELLLNAGADINVSSVKGGSLPITIAISNRDLEMMEYLSRSGADADKKTWFEPSIRPGTYTSLSQRTYAFCEFTSPEDSRQALRAMRPPSQNTKSASCSSARKNKL